jgi:hypothetical protein
MNDDYMRCTGCAKLQLVEHLGQLVCTACGVVNPHVVRDLDTPSSQTERAGKRARVTDESTCKWTLDHGMAAICAGARPFARPSSGRFQGSRRCGRAGADEDDEEAERIASNAVRAPPCPMPPGATNRPESPNLIMFSGTAALPERVRCAARPRACPTTRWLAYSCFSVSFHAYPRFVTSANPEAIARRRPAISY